jgi:outer membrane protein OmpA-like peptidoglycan-associated protein
VIALHAGAERPALVAGIQFVMISLVALAGSARAGDPAGVTAALQSLHGNWPDAQFSVDVAGLSDGEAQIDRPLHVEYEAARPGYIAYLRVSSHGDVSLTRVVTGNASAAGDLSLPIAAPLGRERAIFLFSNQPLDALFNGQAVQAIGADRAHVDSFTRKLEQLQSQGVMLAARRYDYMVDAPTGGTQYTTRSIIREVEGQTGADTREASHPRFPTRIEFEFNSDQLTAQGKKDLDVFGAALASKLRDRQVTLEGHTDALGSDDYNRDLSARRARVAQQYLLDSFGLSTERIAVTGKGKEGPIASNDTEADRSRNRRVDFIFNSPSAAGDGK